MGKATQPSGNTGIQASAIEGSDAIPITAEAHALLGTGGDTQR